jgi:hypothetical protein
MAQQVVVKVPFIADNVSKCLCPGCPVQARSKCVAELKSGLTDALKKNPLKHGEIPGLYCATGKAMCTDIDPKKDCLCSDCAVFSRYGLANGKPDMYFCKEGAVR